jgi:hypothetical protein
MEAILVPCVCCGYYTLKELSSNPYQQCPVCCWITSCTDDRWNKANEVTLEKAQTTFQAMGVCDIIWKETARSPTPEDRIVPNFQTVSARRPRERELAKNRIANAFSELRRGTGMRIFDAEVKDDYGMVSERAKQISQVMYQHWNEIPHKVIEDFGTVLSFFDPESYRFHIPAYMTWTLLFHEVSQSISSSSTVYSLSLGSSQKQWKLERFEGFNHQQKQAVTSFLRYMATFSDDSDDAQEALNQYWHQFDTNVGDLGSICCNT